MLWTKMDTMQIGMRGIEKKIDINVVLILGIRTYINILIAV